MSNLVDTGRLSAAYGIKGWVKVLSQTDPASNLFSYQPWYIKTRHGVKSVELEEWRPHGKGFVAKLKGVDDRSQAESICPVTVAVDKSVLPELDEGDYYWHQLENCRVITRFTNSNVSSERDLGCIKRIMPTGANDVLVVQGDAQSIDQAERLIPYVPGQFVLDVKLDQSTVYVDWDPAF